VDAPTRVMHWLMVLSFLGAYLTADGERWRLLHVTLGYTLAGLLSFRVVWGLIGPRHARLSALGRKLQAMPQWLAGLKSGTINVRLGQNLLLSLSVVMLLGLIAPLTLSGYGTYNEWAGEWLEDVHEFFGNALLAVVLAHVALIAALSLLRRKNQVTPHADGPGRGFRARSAEEQSLSRGGLVAGRRAGILGLAVAAGACGRYWWDWPGRDPCPAAGVTPPARDGAYDGRRARKHGERHHD
jgi:cytochrome b